MTSSSTLDLAPPIDAGVAAVASRAGGELRRAAAAVRVSFTWLGVRKSLSARQRAEAADAFGAEEGFLSAGKKLLDTRHPKFRAVSAVRHRTAAYWRSVSLPFPEPGVRLIRQSSIEAFDQRLTCFRDQLAAAVEDLQDHYAALVDSARQRLGRLFDESDYPPALDRLFGVSWDYPSVEPPDYLRELAPALYRQECRRAAARFDEAVELAEQAFLEELGRLIEHLAERLGGADGQPKIFRDSVVTNLLEFFERFQRLNVRSSAELDALVERARGIVGGVEPQQLRDNSRRRQSVARQLGQLQTSLDAALVDRPRRRILRAR